MKGIKKISAISFATSRGWTIVAKTAIPVIITLLLFIITTHIVSIPSFKNALLESKKQLPVDLSMTILSLLSDYESRVKRGEITADEARRRAILRIRKLRYGPDNKYYFWINDTTPRMIMHPYRPELDGKDLTYYADSSGKRLFVDMVNVTKNNKSGFVEYIWQWTDKADLDAKKISYVVLFEPWQWIIGTGVYYRDVEGVINNLTKNINRAFTAIILVVAAVSSLVIIQSLVREKKRLLAEDNLRKLLVEKEILIKEVHHRVKNNLQIISSLINLQAYSIKDEQMTAIFKETPGRILTLASIHELLYGSDNLSVISIRTIIQNLIGNISYLTGIRERKISISYDIQDVTVPMDIAIPVSLIINEVVTNSFKHAFPERSGTVRIAFDVYDGNFYSLIISDDGIGMARGGRTERSETLGVQLIGALVNQLCGRYELITKEGTEYRFIFPKTVGGR